jgi:hypothetical protein
MKRCSNCGCEKTLDNYYKRGGDRNDYQNTCKDCSRKRAASSQKHRNIKHRYGISVSEYDSIMKPAVECEICGNTEKLVYDHDHNTGQHRGVICTHCNKALGLLGDNIDGVQAALDYLEHHYVNQTNVD